MRVRFLQYRGLGDPVSGSTLTAYKEVMDEAYDAVLTALNDLRARASGYSWSKLITLGPIYGGLMQAPESTRVAILGALGTLENRMRQLGASTIDVYNGTLPLKKWLAAVSAVFDGVKVHARDLNETTILGEATATLEDSWRRAQQFVDRAIENVSTGAKYGLPIIGIALLAAAFVVVPRLLGGTTVVVRK